jgi:RNA polymerase sigma factor (sigma-70 family)
VGSLFAAERKMALRAAVAAGLPLPSNVTSRLGMSGPEAFASFYDRYEASILGYFMHRTRNPEVAAELGAEVFAAALASAARYRPVGPTAAGWLFTIAQNVLLKSARKGRVQDAARRRAGIALQLQLSHASLERIDGMVASDAWVSELLDRLPVDQRDAVRAHILDDCSYEEIAAKSGASEAVIRKRVSRGLATLRRDLRRPYDAGSGTQARGARSGRTSCFARRQPPADLEENASRTRIAS